MTSSTIARTARRVAATAAVATFFAVSAVSTAATAAEEDAPASPSQTVEIAGKLPGEHNPLIGHKFGADGFAFAENGRVYMFMTNDTQGYAPDPANGISPQIDYGDINRITLISSDDFVNWTDHGEIQVAGPEGLAPWASNSWAPGFGKRTVDGVEKYFLYFANNATSVGVLTASSPLGPWTSEREDAIVTRETPGAEDVSWVFDPAPLVTDDGSAYLYFGGGPPSDELLDVEKFNNPKNIRVIELGDDMVSTTGVSAVVDAPVAFEAAQVFERNGLYYLSYSSHFGGPDFGGPQTPAPGYPGGGQIAYMVSEDPTAFPKETYEGVIFSNPGAYFEGAGGNNHQSIFEFGGKHYFTYHAATVNARIAGGTNQGYRSPHMQEVTFNDDGTIRPITGDFAGVEQVKNFDPYRVFEAETLGYTKGIATGRIDGASAEFGAGTPNLTVRDIDDGDWTALSSVDFGQAGAAAVTVKVRPLQAGGEMRVRLDSADGPTVGTIPVEGTAGEWTELTAELEGAVGVHDVYFTYAGPEGDLLELDTLEFGDAVSTLEIRAAAASRCVLGRAVVTAQAVNESGTPVDMAFATSYGSAKDAAVNYGSRAFYASSRLSAKLPAGTVTVTATATVDGSPVSVQREAAYPARSCR